VEVICIPCECTSILPCESNRRYDPGLDFSVMTYYTSHFDSNLLELSVRGLRKRTRSPTLKVLCFTYLSLHDFVSVWYFYKLVTAFSLSDSNRSLSSASNGQNVASGIIRVILCLIFSGVTTSAPNISQNSEKFVAHVLWLHITFVITSPNLPFFLPSTIFLFASKIRAFAISTAPLVWW
jgi:hypothetical protein